MITWHGYTIAQYFDLAPHPIRSSLEKNLSPVDDIMFRNQYDQARWPITFSQKFVTNSVTLPGHSYLESARASSPNRM